MIYAVANPERLSRRATKVLTNAGNGLELSSVSLVEIAVKTSLGKLDFPIALLRHAIQDLNIRILSLTAEHAFAVFDLPLLHSDPFDRQIIAQALSEKLPIVTPDAKFGIYTGLKVIW